MKTNIWQLYENDLIGLWPILPITELTKLFPFSQTAIKARAGKLKLKKLGKLYSWRYADELELIKIYANTTNLEISEKLGKTEAAISAAGFKLGLRKTPEFMRYHSAKTQFVKGHQSHNKGKRQIEYMKPEAIERTKATRFKKGQLPHNSYNEVGKIVVRYDNRNIPYQFICLKIGVWLPLHTHIWQQAYGRVPKNYCLWFKDGNSLNAKLENIECISRKENMQRNAMYDNPTDNRIAAYMAISSRTTNNELKKELLKHPDLLEAKRKQIKINRKLKQLQHGTQQNSRP